MADEKRRDLARRQEGGDRGRRVVEPIGDDYLLGLKASILRAVGDHVEERFRALDMKVERVLHKLDEVQEHVGIVEVGLRDVVKSASLGEIQQMESRINDYLERARVGTDESVAEVRKAVATILSKEEALKQRLDDLRREEERIESELGGRGP